MKVILSLLLAASALAETPQCLQEEKTGERTPETSAAALLSVSGIGDDEIFTRLVFSETLASNCAKTAEADAVAQGIAWIVSNRTREPKRFGNGTAVVTAPKQFRSTFGTYDVSRRKEFLCPEKTEGDWKTIWTKAESAWKATADPAKNPLPGAFHYYLGRHFKSSKLKVSHPAWAKPPNKRLTPTLPGLEKKSTCISFWK